MIEAKDLRIGNWVILDWDGDKRPQTIAAINRTHFEMQDWDEQFDAFDLYPIPLTPEIMAKCKNEMEMIGLRLIQGLCYVDRKGDTITAFNYLHEYQNFYFVMTGKELQIKNLTNEQRQ